MTLGSNFGQVAPLEIGLTVRDLDTSLLFWRDMIGLEQVSRIDNPADTGRASGISQGAYTVVRLQFPGGERLKLFAPVDVADSPSPGLCPLSKVGLAFITLIVDDITGVMGHLSGLSAVVRQPRAVELRKGVFVALVEDPDGNVVELVQYANLSRYRPELGRSGACDSHARSYGCPQLPPTY